MKTFFNKETSIYLIAVLASVTITMISTASSNFNINLDGILYLRVASTYLEQGFSAALAVYSWPFYSILTAYVHKLTHLPLVPSFYMVNLIFQAITITFYIAIIKQLGGNRRIQWIALCVILVFPQFNDYRHYLIRDFGFWAFYMVALYAFLRFVDNKQWRYAITWSISILLSCFFRLEGIVFFIFIPFVLFFQRPLTFKQKVALFSKAQALTLLLLFIMLVLGLISERLDLLKFGKAHEFHQLILSTIEIIQHKFNLAVSALRESVLTHPAKRTAPVLVLAGLVGLYLYKLVTSFSFVYVAIVMYALFTRKLKANRNAIAVLIFFIVLNTIITACFISMFYFVNSRYLIAMELVLLLWVPFGIEGIYKYWQSSIYKPITHQLIFPLVVLGMGFMLVDGVYSFGYSKAYLRETGHWLATQTPTDKEIYTNSPQILYMARGAVSSWRQDYDDLLKKIYQGGWQEYDYLAINLTHKHLDQEPRIERIINQKPCKSFSSGRGGKVNIYCIGGAHNQEQAI